MIVALISYHYTTGSFIIILLATLAFQSIYHYFPPRWGCPEDLRFSQTEGAAVSIPHGATSEDLGEVGLSFGSQLQCHRQWRQIQRGGTALVGYGGRIGTNSGGGVRFGTTL